MTKNSDRYYYHNRDHKVQLRENPSMRTALMEAHSTEAMADRPVQVQVQVFIQGLPPPTVAGFASCLGGA